MMQPYEPSEESSMSQVSSSAEWWVNSPHESLGAQAGSKDQQRKASMLKEEPTINWSNGMPIHSAGGEKHISYDQAKNWLWETGSSAV